LVQAGKVEDEIGVKLRTLFSCYAVSFF
jgi:hypothetical protein